MKKRLLVSLAALLLSASPMLLSQSLTGTGYEEAQQNSSVDSADSVSSTGQGYMVNQQQSQRQGQLNEPGMAGPRSLGTATSEDTTLSGQPRISAQRPMPALPPDQLTEFQKYVAATTGQMLPIYGANLFRNVPSTFAPVDLAPVTADYVIGPEDELRVRIWGQINYSGNLRVDRSGNIYLPQVGTVHVAGLQFSTVDQHLRSAVGRVYRNFDLSVDIGRIRSMQIYVTGQARRPGAYTVSSLSSLVNALFASGGPSPQGSLRHIQLNRNGKTIADFDLYALLIHGDKSHDVRLLPEDVLYISAVGPQVAISGSINNPGIYELRAGETIRDLIDAAGKTSTLASNSRISLERVEKRQLRQALEFGFDDNGLSATLAGGDILRIYAILPAYQKTVTLRGNVANPGRFTCFPGMRLSDLIPDRDSLVSRDYWWKRSHLGLPAPEFEPIISTIGQGQQPPESSRRGLTTSVTQETLTAALTRNDQQNFNAPSQDANAFSQDTNAYNQETNAYNQNANAYNQGTNAYNQNANAYNQGASALGVKPESAGRTGSSSSLASQYTQMSTPGGTGQRKRVDVRLSAPEINWDYAVIERIDPDTLKSSLIPFDLGKLVLNHDAGQDLPVQPGDTITVFSQADIRVPIDHQTKYVDLEGEIVHAGTYSVLPGETLRDLVRRAGGFTQNAYLYGAEFTRESTRVVQQQKLDEYVRNVSMDAVRGTQALAVSGNSSANNESLIASSRAISQDLIARLSQIRATGRIVLQFQATSKALENVPAINLENGDRFVVPFVPSSVNVTGAVYNQSSFLYHSKWTVGHYMQLAGGPNRNADSRHAFVVRADGSVVSRAAVKGVSLWTNSFNQLSMNPGDTVVVPDKTIHPSVWRQFTDMALASSLIAVAATR